MACIIHEFESIDSLASALSDNVALLLQQGVNVKEKASLVVSGGNTPKRFFQHLQQHVIDWEHVYITLADERWVDRHSLDSNEKLVREYLLKNIKAQFIPLKNDAPTVEEGAKHACSALKTMPRPFDVVVLGMGGDGHTASLFPFTQGLEDALDLENSSECMAFRPSGVVHPRLSLTLRSLLNSSIIILHITGKRKYEILQEALNTPSESSEILPIRAILHQDLAPVHVYYSP